MGAQKETLFPMTRRHRERGEDARLRGVEIGNVGDCKGLNLGLWMGHSGEKRGKNT